MRRNTAVNRAAREPDLAMRVSRDGLRNVGEVALDHGANGLAAAEENLRVQKTVNRILAAMPK